MCFEQQPELWRMSKADGKATLIKAQSKKNVFILKINKAMKLQAEWVATICPVKIIKLS